MSVGPDMPMSYLHMTFKFLNRIFQINKNGAQLLDGVTCLNLLVVILENMQGMIDNELQTIVGIIVKELDFVRGRKQANGYRSMCLQTLASAFTYNAQLTFQCLGENL